VKRGDTGLGRDAYGLPRRRRHGERRAYRVEGDAEASGARGTDGVNGLGDDEDDEYYGQLLRRPGDLPAYPRQPGRPGTRQPGRVPPPTYPPNGNPGGGYPPNGNPAGGYPRNGNLADRYPPNGRAAAGGPLNRGPVSGGPVRGGPASGGPVNGGPVRSGPISGGPISGGPASGGPISGGPASGGPISGGPRPGREYRLPDGPRVPSTTGQPYRPPAPGSAGPTRGRRGPGQDPPGGMWRGPTWPSPAPGAPPGPGGTQAHGGMSGSGPGARAGIQPESGIGWGHLRVPPAGPGVPISGEPAAPGGPAGSPGPVIRRRESAVPDQQPAGAAQSVASIAPDGLESFARDLRALRARAEIDYPELAELSHYTMKTLASAAGGLRLPTLPVAVAYVRACGGNVTEWEDRWQKLAAKIGADEAKKRRSETDEQQAPPEPADAPDLAEPPGSPAADDPDPGPGAVYVITSAKPRQPGWPTGQG
jgi:hypothetical protein